MRILHTSDWHLGLSLHNVSQLYVQDKFIETLKDIIQNEKIDVIIVAGDVFDSSVASSEAISLYNKAITTIHSLSIPIIIIAGNHDGAARLASCNQLLKNSNLFISGKLEKYIIPTIIDNVAFYAIPFFNIDEVRALYPDMTIKTYQDAMSCVCDSIRFTMDCNCVNIVIAHAFVSGAILSDSDKSAMLGSTTMISSNVFNGFSYTALGHLHRPQNVGNMVRYCGSPLKYSFSEVYYNKSVTIIDTSNMNVTECIITPYKDLKLLTGSYNELLENATYCDDFIKIEVIDRYIGLECLNTFRQFYPNLLSISGKSYAYDDAKLTLTLNQIENLTPLDIMKKFFDETLEYIPTDEQILLFNTALSEVEAMNNIN